MPFQHAVFSLFCHDASPRRSICCALKKLEAIIPHDVSAGGCICMALALLGFCTITLAHTACIVAYRVAQVLRGFPVTGFKKSRTEPENSLYGRVCASHANCLENLP